MAKTITLFTDLGGYELFKLGKPFMATTEEKEGDYKVTVPVENLVNLHLEDELESYDVVDTTDVSVVKEIK